MPEKEEAPPITYHFIDEQGIIRCLCSVCGQLENKAWRYQGIYGSWEYKCFRCNKIILEKNQ
jgi:hypothetical protein